MCRYATTYKIKWVCFGCRKSFKRQPEPLPRDYALALRRGLPVTPPPMPPVRCPHCAGTMQKIGLDFHAPARDNDEQWRKVAMLFAHGINYHSCGCGGPGPRPARLRDVPAFLEAERDHGTLRTTIPPRPSATTSSQRKRARRQALRWTAPAAN